MPDSMDARELLNELLVDIFNQILAREEEAISKFTDGNLTITEIHTLEAVGFGLPRKMSEVATKLGITVSTLTVAINKLEKKGFVERLRCDDDKRVVHVVLTEAGGKAVNCHTAFHQHMVNNIIGQLDESEMDIFIRSISKLNKFFEKK